MATLFSAIAAILSAIYATLFTNAAASWPKSAIKTGSVAALALAGASLAAPPLIILGLACGAVGDFCLSRDGRRAFLAGMAAFALGHLAYAAAFAQSATGVPIIAPIVIGLLVLSTEFWLAPHTGVLRWPVRLYGAVIGAMGVAAAALPSGLHWITAGAGLFILSDILLSLQLFVVRNDSARLWLGRSLWPAYWAGQALILFGSLASGPA
ncbi:MAG: lysoplasmalogenase [Rhodobacteraceae bacterium]|nr:lysoplasmalogenase [Paracoccaceae bacterium]